MLFVQNDRMVRSNCRYPRVVKPAIIGTDKFVTFERMVRFSNCQVDSFDVQVSIDCRVNGHTLNLFRPLLVVIDTKSGLVRDVLSRNHWNCDVFDVGPLVDVISMKFHR
jgi:hypothetical protein